MPTGYTNAIANGISFEDFAMNCARAFAACVTLRDEDGGGEVIPDEFKASGHNLARAEAKRAELAELLSLTAEQVAARADARWQEQERERLRYNEKLAALRAKYEAMLAKVDAWNPPTPEHLGIKRFMREQIQESIRFDCSGTSGMKPAARVTGAEWLARRVADLRSDIQRSMEEHEKEVTRAAQSTLWVRQLRASLATCSASRGGA